MKIQLSISQRLVKTPVLYFVDTGLACRLLQIERAEQLTTHPHRGALFQTWVASELLKRRLNAGLESDLHFWRDRSGHEVDLLVGAEGHLIPIEVKSGQTAASDASASLQWWLGIAGNQAEAGVVVYGGDQSYDRSGIRYLGWRDLPRAAL